MIVQLADKTKRYEIYAIITIITMIVAGIWIFGFDDELFGTKPIKQDSIPQPMQQKPLAQKMPIENQQSKSYVEPAQKPTTALAEKPIIQHYTNKNPDPSTLEDARFELDVDGTAYTGSPSLAKPAEITLKLIPIKGSKLEKFDVSDGKIIIGNMGISFDKGIAEIKGTTISISVTNDDSLDPFFSIIGILDEPILSDKDSTQRVSFSDQLVYFGKKDESIPHHFDVSGKLKH